MCVGPLISGGKTVGFSAFLGKQIKDYWVWGTGQKTGFKKKKQKGQVFIGCFVAFFWAISLKNSKKKGQKPKGGVLNLYYVFCRFWFFPPPKKRLFALNC